MHPQHLSTTVRLTLSAALVAIVSGLAGCASPSGASTETPVASSESTASPVATASTSAITDAESCQAFQDVSTILFNAEDGLRAERMSRQEYDGWMRLATRVLDRVPTRGEGAVSDAIVTLKQMAPPVPIGALGPATINTREWQSATTLAADCAAAGQELGVEAFNGG